MNILDILTIYMIASAIYGFIGFGLGFSGKQELEDLGAIMIWGAIVWPIITILIAKWAIEDCLNNRK